jgi:cell division protein FtsZ
VIAAGFDGGSPKHKPIESPRKETAPATPAVPQSAMPMVTSRYGPPATSGARGGSAGSGAGSSAGGGHVRRAVELDEELDVPDFLKG